MELPAATNGVEYYYPNKMVRVILLAMEEVMTRNGVNAILNLAHLKYLVNNYPVNNFDRQVTFRELGTMMRSLDEMYGPQGGRGLALRAGRASFKYGLKEFGPVVGMADLSFSLMPLPMKLRVGANVFCETFNKFSDQVVRLTETDDRLIWENLRCPVCWGRHSDSPCCFLAVGVLQEALYWASGGKYFEVNETTCVACGDEVCTIVIEKTPLE
jgi:predicted hydrocarbon binding protein